jgi:predicted SAM-dependent methyltransferase
MFKSFLRKRFSRRTLLLLQMDLLRWRTRCKRAFRGRRSPPFPRLHLGCGTRKIVNWHNVDLVGSDEDVDLGSVPLPWPDGSFDAIVSQHVIEHLDLRTEALPLLRELHRVLRNQGEIWLSCPDMAKICRAYVDGRISAMVEDRRSRFPQFSLQGAPDSQMVNELFHQSGEHKNLFDFSLLAWCLQEAEFVAIEQVAEDDLLARYPDFPRRNDDAQSLYVRAMRTDAARKESFTAAAAQQN